MIDFVYILFKTSWLRHIRLKTPRRGFRLPQRSHLRTLKIFFLYPRLTPKFRPRIGAARYPAKFMREYSSKNTDFNPVFQNFKYAVFCSYLLRYPLPFPLFLHLFHCHFHFRIQIRHFLVFPHRLK